MAIQYLMQMTLLLCLLVTPGMMCTQMYQDYLQLVNFNVDKTQFLGIPTAEDDQPDQNKIFNHKSSCHEAQNYDSSIKNSL